MDGWGTWRGRPPAVWTLAVFAVVGAVLCSVPLAIPGAARSLTTLDLAVALTGLALASWLWMRTVRLTTTELHLALLLCSLVTALLVARAVTGEGAVSAAVATMWIVVHAAVFLDRRAGCLHALFAVTACAVGFAGSVPTVTGALAWVVVSASALTAGGVLSSLLRQLRAQTRTDPLTGVFNRVGFEEAVARERPAAARDAAEMTLVVLDLDGFKQVNDAEGHAAGDRVLVELALGWRTHLRPRDVVARIGGDEFALALPGTDRPATDRLLDRLHRDAPIGFSVGIVTLGVDEPIDIALRRADQEMYRHKRTRLVSGLEPAELPAVAGPCPPQAVV